MGLHSNQWETAPRAGWGRAGRPTSLPGTRPEAGKTGCLCYSLFIMKRPEIPQEKGQIKKPCYYKTKNLMYMI